MIPCICLLSIYLNFTIESIPTVYKLFTGAGECFIEHLLIMSTLFINIEVLVYNLPKNASSLVFLNKIRGVAWTIK